MLAVTLVATYRSSVTANMNLIGERYFWYRYRMQCDPGLYKSDIRKFSECVTEILNTNLKF